ncbi:MAG: hypothetical protein AAGC71_14100 [Pseudomonadota bacterium]
MATRKKGQLTTSPEWGRHLRPLLKRWFWKGERRAVLGDVAAEVNGAYLDSVDEILLEVASWDGNAPIVELAVTHAPQHRSTALSIDVAMAIVMDTALARGYGPAGRDESMQGYVYRYQRIDD